MIVDDDTDFRAELREYLSDFRITEAANGEEAIKELKKPNQIDLVILDVMMPGNLGTQVLKDIKKISPGIKVIILTGFSSKDVAIEALKGKADDYIEKPLNIGKLHEVIDQLCTWNNNNGKDVMECIKRYTEKNINKNVGLKDAAVSVGLSPKYLSRLFKEKMGIGYNQYKQELRLKRAKDLLDNTEFTIAHISFLLGYENVESFIRRFKALTGKTPSKFRARKGK